MFVIYVLYLRIIFIFRNIFYIYVELIFEFGRLRFNRLISENLFSDVMLYKFGCL